MRLLAESVAGLPLHLYRFTDDAENGKEKAKDHPLYRLLYILPNPEMTSFSFREVMMTHLLLWQIICLSIVFMKKQGISIIVQQKTMLIIPEATSMSISR